MPTTMGRISLKSWVASSYLEHGTPPISKCTTVESLKTGAVYSFLDLYFFPKEGFDKQGFNEARKPLTIIFYYYEVCLF